MLLINKSGRNVISLFISLLLKDGDCVKKFNSDKEIKEYIEKSIDSIKVLDECRLYREEQLQITEEVMRARNSTEWLIRINKVINNFTYAISRSYAYAVKMNWPLEETENSQMYAYYLEDAVYRDIVLWDLLRQFINEFFKCGYDKDREISIFSFLNDVAVRRKLGNSEVKKLKKYLNCADHQEVRTKLRNQFTHSLDGTSSYLFHRNNNGKIQADMGNVFPKHPYENIVYVLDDIKKYLKFAELYVGKLENFLIENIMMVTVECNMKCGKVAKDTKTWSINILKDNAERILVPCENSCEYAIDYNKCKVCKPMFVKYCRINEEDKKYKGKIELQMNYEKMKEQFGEDATIS